MVKLNKKYVVEAKQVGTLYHLCTLDDLEYIIPRDTLKSSGLYYNKLLHTDKAISFTRDKNFFVDVPKMAHSPVLIQFVVDGDKLSENYKITPYNDFYTRQNTQDDKVILPQSPLPYNPKFLEKEEVVIGPITNFSNYIKSIRVIVNELPEKKLADIQYVLEDLIYYKTQYNIPLELVLNDSTLSGKIQDVDDILGYVPEDIPSLEEYEERLSFLFSTITDSKSFNSFVKYLNTVIDNGYVLQYQSPISKSMYVGDFCVSSLRYDLEKVDYKIDQHETYVGSDSITLAFKLKGYPSYGSLELVQDI